jgi:hypothetical protein
MTLTGEVREVFADDRVVSVAVRGANGMGDHVNATVEVQLP